MNPCRNGGTCESASNTCTGYRCHCGPNYNSILELIVSIGMVSFDLALEMHAIYVMRMDG
jgi:hypothetical protein